MGSIAADVASNRYIALTTFRRSGEPVITPVWVADLGDGTVGFTTGSDSGKVKRLTNNADVSVSPCNVRGVVAVGSPVWRGSARLARGADYGRVRHAIKRRYHVQFLLIDLAGRLRRRPAAEVGIVISFADTTRSTAEK